MNVSRWIRHFLIPPWRVKRVFPAPVLSRIEQAIEDAERHHTGQIRFAVEHALDAALLSRGVSAGDRALDVFSRLRVWDTAQNNGVLIYLLLADRDVEIVADRGIHQRAGAEAWETICGGMEKAFRAGRFEAGVIEGIEQVSRILREQFPRATPGPNELPDRPIVI